MAGGAPLAAPAVSGGYLTGRALIFPLSLVISLFFLWGFSYGLLDVLNKHFQTVLGISKLESTGLQVMYFGGGYLLFSPVAAEVLKRRGYKFAILMGLSLYSLGAVLFWPVAHASLFTDNKRAIFGGFCVCTLVIACGLATLETSANSYAVVIGKPETASARLQFCQSWNGVASFIGPLIASKFFFEGANANSLTNVQYVYLAVSCAGVAVALLFFFARLPEVSEQALEEAGPGPGPGADAAGQPAGQGPLYRQFNLIFAFVAQFCYVGSQVTVATWFINYAHENGGLSDSQGANFLSFALMTFTVGRFVATALATVFQSDFLLVIYAAAAIALTAYCSVGTGTASVGVLMTIFFFEAPMYPILFTLGTANLGRHTRRGAGIMVQAVAGAAVFVPVQGAIADAAHVRISYVVPLVGFTYVVGYATYHWFSHGRNIMRVKGAPAAETEAESVVVDGDGKNKADKWVESV
ncbi:major facilitator superfamily transporter [Colletotrichum falcatum]|nr:major facilitator superfamily transporter [Colletotrichum falcatum]